MLLYHHNRSLESVIFGEVKANPEHSDPEFKDAYSWLERQVGFYPLFLADGTTEDDIRMTGYQSQWAKVNGSEIVGRRKDGSYIQRYILRKKGEFPNYVLFSFEEVDGVFTDFDYWHIPLNSIMNGYEVTDYERRLTLKPSWPKSKWLRKAKKDPYSVQLVTSTLYLPDAKRVWVKNKQTKIQLESMGFENVEVKRLLINEPEHN